MKLSDYVVLGKPFYMDRDFIDDREESSTIMLAYTAGQKAVAQGFHLLGFCFRQGQLKVQLGEEPAAHLAMEEYG